MATLDDEEIKTIVRDVAVKNHVPVEIEDITTALTIDSDGLDALDIVISRRHQSPAKSRAKTLHSLSRGFTSGWQRPVRNVCLLSRSVGSMHPEPELLLQQAAALIAGQPDETALRSAANRAYYAVFHHILRYVTDTIVRKGSRNTTCTGQCIVMSSMSS